MNNKKILCALFFSALFAISAMMMASAAAATNTVEINSPIKWYNYTTNITLNVSLNNTVGAGVMVVNITNVSVFYSNDSGVKWYHFTGTGGTAIVLLNTRNPLLNDTREIQLSNSSVSITNLSSNINYNFTLLICNNSGNTGNCNWSYDLNVSGLGGRDLSNVTFDNNAPRFGVNMNFSAPARYTNYSVASLRNSTILVNVSLKAPISGIGYAIVNISRNTLQIANYTLVTEGTVGSDSYNWSVSFSPANDTGFADAHTYNISVYAVSRALNTSGHYDAINRINTSNDVKSTNLTIDNTAPALTLSCTATVDQGETETCTCSGTDATTGMNLSGYGTSGYSFTAHPSTASSGPQTTYCSAKDMVDNVVQAEYTYTVYGEAINNRGSTSTSSGTTTAPTTAIEAVTSWTTAATLTTSEASTGATETVAAKERVQVQTSATESVYIGVAELTTTTATVGVVGTDTESTLLVGEVAKFDTNSDGVYDISATLNGISDGKADLKLQIINEKIEAEALPEETQESTGLAGLSYTWWIVIVVAVIIIAVVAYMLIKRKKFY